MSDIFHVTKSQLIEAFKIYNAEYLENKDNFGEIQPDEETAVGQAEKLLAILIDLQPHSENLIND